MAKIKICGITNCEDAACAISNGADYIGLIFAPSKRQIIKETALRIIQTNPHFNNYVGVFMNGKKKQIEDICAQTGIRIVQFHGDETPAFCNYFINRGIEVIKAIRVSTDESLRIIDMHKKIKTILLDTFVPDQYGGTGKSFDWNIVLRNDWIKKKNIIISGGIGTHNVINVITLLNPFAVDASSLLEREPGIKDHEKVRDFIAQVKGCHNG